MRLSILPRIAPQVAVFSVAITAIQVARERIRITPLPFTYTLLLHRIAYAYCLLLPFGLGNTLGYATPLFCALVAYAFFGLDALGDELEEPFGTSLNALPLDAMARTVEITARRPRSNPSPSPSPQPTQSSASQPPSPFPRQIRDT